MSAVLGALFGAFIGSFLNVCVHRLPRNESVVQPPSRCYACGARVRWYDNLPVLSYLLLGGRCRWCGTGFSARYLAMELLVAALTAATTWWAFDGGAPLAAWLAVAGAPAWAAHAAAAAALLCLAWYLVVATLVDLEHTIIPDELTKSFQLAAPLLAMAAGSNALFGWQARGWMEWVDVYGDRHPDLGGFALRMGAIVGGALAFLLVSLPVARAIYSRFCPEHERWRDDDHRGFRAGVLWYVGVTAAQGALLAGLVAAADGRAAWLLAAAQLAQALLGSLAGWLALYLVGLLGTIAFRKNAMGFGDVKFLAPVGAFLGPFGVLYAFFGAAVVGSLVNLPMYLAGSRRQIPFGPYLAGGTVLAVAVGPFLHRLWFG